MATSALSAKFFHDERAAFAWLESILWPNGPVCPHCGERTEIFAHGGARREAEKLGVPFLGEVPLDLAIRETSDGGRPIVVSAPQGENALIFRRMAATVADQLGTAAPAPPRIVVE